MSAAIIFEDPTDTPVDIKYVFVVSPVLVNLYVDVLYDPVIVPNEFVASNVSNATTVSVSKGASCCIER